MTSLTRIVGTLHAFTGEGAGPRTMGFDITAGGIEDGCALLRTGGFKIAPDPAMLTYPLFKAVLR
jgi:hypothetical protein